MSAQIEVKNLRKTFYTNGIENEVLKGINLTIQKGEIFGIIGFSGAGKSTLARCINHLETPDDGEIYVDGVDVTKLKKEALRKNCRKVGMIFQNFNLFDSMTVEKNIAYPLSIAHVPKKEIQQRVKRVAELVGLTEKLKNYPGELSGGQKQRVGIARSLIGEPEVLLSDEATSELDPQTTIQILDLLKEINEKAGITILMITHELDAIRYSCKRMAVLEEGRIIEEGNVFDVFQNPSSRTGELFARVSAEFRQYDEYEAGSGI